MKWKFRGAIVTSGSVPRGSRQLASKRGGFTHADVFITESA